MNKMQIPALGKLTTECWVTAENTLRANVRRKFSDRDEEIITTLFHGELEDVCEKVSKSGAIATAFLRAGKWGTLMN